jgi:pilus assembly protein CpaB
MILQNVPVLKLGDFELPQVQVTTEQPAQEGEVVAAQPVIPDVVTLIVTPQDSVTLSYLVYSGAKMNMTLRNVLDESRVATEAATLQFLLSQYNIPVPAKLPYTMQPRIDRLTYPPTTLEQQVTPATPVQE